LKIKLKGRHLDTTDVIKAESQAVLKTLTEHDLQDAFKKWQKHWERCIRMEGDYFEVASRPEASFDQMAAPVWEIMDGSLYKSDVLVSKPNCVCIQ
jgi:hypothetical protein